DVDQARVVLRAIADQPAGACTRHVDGDGHAVADVLLGQRADEAVHALQRAHLRIGYRRRAAANAKLAQARSRAHQNAERARGHLGVQRTAVLLGHAVELRAVVGDEPREDVETAGGAFRIADRGHPMAQSEAFEQRHDVDAAALEHRPVRQVHLVHREIGELLLHRRALARQEARAHAVRGGSETKIKARRLDLAVVDRVERDDLAADPDQPLELLARQYSRRMPGARLRGDAGFEQIADDDARPGRIRHARPYVFCTTMFGNFPEKSSTFFATAIATLRAIALYLSATAPSGSATTVGRPESACSRMLMSSGRLPSNSTS